MVSACPESPNAKFAGVRCGVQGTSAVGGTETPPNWPGRKKAAFKLLLTSPADCSELFGPSDKSAGRRLANVAVGSKAALADLKCDFRSTSNNGHHQADPVGPVRATSGLMHRSNYAYSTTSSAIASTPDEIVRPSVLAVLVLMTSSNLIGCSTGRSAGFSPFKIFAT